MEPHRHTAQLSTSSCAGQRVQGVVTLLLSEFLSHQEGLGVYWFHISQEVRYTRGPGAASRAEGDAIAEDVTIVPDAANNVEIDRDGV